MVNNKDVLNILFSLSQERIDDEYYFMEQYLKLKNEYPNYTMDDLLVICKIDILEEMKIINSETHNYLIQLYNELKVLEEKCLCEADEVGQDVYNRLGTIGGVLVDFNIYPISLVGLVLNSIIPSDYHDLNKKCMILKQKESKNLY
jgi:hypothetical protein